MTLKSLLNWGGLGTLGKGHQTPIERWHGGGGPWEHKSHGHGHYKGGGGKGSGAALSALTLLAFLFLLNVMQQSLNDNNSTATSTTMAVLLRDDPIVLTARDRDVENTKSRDLPESRDNKEDGHTSGYEKGDMLGRKYEDQYSQKG